MEKFKFHRTLLFLTLMVAFTVLVASCGPSYLGVNNGYRYNRPYYGYSRPYYRYSVPPPVVVVPRYAPRYNPYYGGGRPRGGGGRRGRF